MKLFSRFPLFGLTRSNIVDVFNRLTFMILFNQFDIVKLYFSLYVLHIETIYGPRSDKRDLMAIKVESVILTHKNDQPIVNNY